MKKAFALFFVGIPLCFAANEPEIVQWADSGIIGPKYETILEEMERVRSEYPELTTIEDYGKSVKGQPLRMMIVMQPGSFRERPALFMSGNTHGNEYLNLEDRLPEEILRLSRAGGDFSRFLKQGGAFVFVPVMNPDGYRAHARENAHGVDLNRDWDVSPLGYKGFKEVESRALATQLDRLATRHRLKYEITVDYHCCIGALLSPWGYTDNKPPPAAYDRHAAIGRLAELQLKVPLGSTSDVLGYKPVGTTKDYYFVKYDARAFTYEGRHGVEHKFLAEHVRWWESMAGFVTRQPVAAFLPKLLPERHPFFHFAD